MHIDTTITNLKERKKLNICGCIINRKCVLAISIELKYQEITLFGMYPSAKQQFFSLTLICLYIGPNSYLVTMISQTIRLFEENAESKGVAAYHLDFMSFPP